MDVAILGCGPAGLIAAHAAAQEGADDIVIYSKRDKSLIHGAQYLHEPIPGLTSASPDGIVKFIKHGTRAGYATKVYGSPDAPCSWDAFDAGERQAWKMDALYDLLWETWYDSIINEVIDADNVPDLLDENDLVISSIPKMSLCDHGHNFDYKEVWITDYNTLPYDVADNVVLYNGDPFDHWYRASNLFGHESCESTSPMTGAVRGVKPLSNNCDCHSGKIAHVGRFGRWEKGVLVHDAYRNAIEACRAVQSV